MDDENKVKPALNEIITRIRDVKNIPNNTEIICFGRLSEVDERLASNEQKYIHFEVGDKSTTIIGKSWGTTLEEFNFVPGDIVKLKVQVNDYEKKKQLKLLRNAKQKLVIRLIKDTDELDESEFIKTAPVNATEMYDFIWNLFDGFVNQEIKQIGLRILEKYKEQLLIYAGGLKVHHAMKSGLMYHIYRMIKQGINFGEVYDDVNGELLSIGILSHDIGKIKELEVDRHGIATGYTKRGSLVGHIGDGLVMMDEIYKELNISEENRLLIDHMIVSHHYEASWGAMNQPRFKEAQLLHEIDSSDSKIDMINNASEDVEAGDFTNKVYFLGNREMYVPIVVDNFSKEPEVTLTPVDELKEIPEESSSVESKVS